MQTKLNIYEEVRKNKIRSILLVLSFFVFTLLIGYIIGFFWGNTIFSLILTAIISSIYFLIVFKSGDSMVLSMTKAKPLTKQENPYIYHIVEGLAIAAGLKKTPKVYIIEDKSINAFATGKNQENSVIVLTRGAIEKLNRQEIEGVIAHEMSHILNNDIRVMMLATVLVGVITFLSELFLRSMLFSGFDKDEDNKSVNIIFIIIGLVLLILAPIIAQMIKLAISRKREFLADANGALLTRYPPGLANALKKIKKENLGLKNASSATAHLFFTSPFKKKKLFSNLFSTHPDIDERIRRLENM